MLVTPVRQRVKGWKLTIFVQVQKWFYSISISLLLIIKYCLTMLSLVMKIATFGLRTASLHQAMRSTGYVSPIKHDAPLCLVGFQQLWLAYFDPRCYGELFSRWPAVVRLSCCCVSWSWASMLLELLGWSLMWIASLACVCNSMNHMLSTYQCT